MKFLHRVTSSQPGVFSSGFPHSAESLTTNSSKCYPDADRVYVQPFTNEIHQPRVYKQTSLTGVTSTLIAEWEYDGFLWFSDLLEKELPVPFYGLLKLLKVAALDYLLEVNGYTSYEHRPDPYRRCSIKRIVLPMVRCGRYHPYSSVKHRRRASKQALERLEYLEEKCWEMGRKFDYLIKLDLTLPKPVSESWASKKVDHSVHRAVNEFLVELQQELFGKHRSQFGAIANHHFWATHSPLTPHRHIHLTIPNVTYNQNRGAFYRFRPYIDADLIKEVWKRCLIRNGLWIGVPDEINPDVYIGYIKFVERDKVIHRLSYCSRCPIEDLAIELTEADLEDVDEDFAKFLLNYTPRRHNLGFLANLNQFGYVSRKSIVMRCPICGGEMRPERDIDGKIIIFEKPPPDIPRLDRDSRGNWHRV